MPPHGATTWCNHPGPLTLPKSARNKDPPEGAGPELAFFLIQWNHDGKIKTASKRKKKVKCFNTKPILLKLICFVEEALCFGQLRPATQLLTPPSPTPLLGGGGRGGYLMFTFLCVCRGGAGYGGLMADPASTHPTRFFSSVAILAQTMQLRQ